MKKRVLTVFLLAALCCLFCFSSAGSVRAHAEGVTLQSTGYDLHPLSGTMTLSFFQNNVLSQWVALTPADGNVYSFTNTSSSTVDQITFSAVDSGFDIVFNQSLYDYYFVVTVFADSTTSDFTFFPDYMSCQTYPCDDPNKWYAFQELNSKHFDTQTSRGYTIVGRLNRSLTSSRIQQVSMSSRSYPEDVFTLPANLKLSCSVVEVPKNSVTSADIQSIIGKIDEQTDVISGSIEDAADQIADQIEKQYKYSEGDDLGVGSIIEEYEDKVGLLTFASDTFLGMLDLFSPENAGDPEIVVPAWSMNIQGTNYQVWDEYRFNLRFIDDNFPFLMRSVRLVTVSLFYLGIIKYIKKIAERWFLAR